MRKIKELFGNWANEKSCVFSTIIKKKALAICVGKMPETQFGPNCYIYKLVSFVLLYLIHG